MNNEQPKGDKSSEDGLVLQIVEAHYVIGMTEKVAIVRRNQRSTNAKRANYKKKRTMRDQTKGDRLESQNTS